jgi:cytochrome c553
MKKILFLVATLLATTVFASNGANLYHKCNSCHGQLAEKKALGKSKVIAMWSSERIEKALKGYKDGTYGGTLKATMKSQVSRLSDEDIKALADYIDSLM